MGATAEQRDTGWLTAYALVVASSVPSDAEACRQILEVTTDRRALMDARTSLGFANSTAVGTRRRAAQLLSRAVRNAEPMPGHV